MAMRDSEWRLNRTAVAWAIVVAVVSSAMVPVFSVLDDVRAAPMGGKYGGDYRIALKAEPGAINPLADPDEVTLQIIDIVYDSLARRNPATLELEPWVADSWEVDNLSVTVELRTDVYWHDGSPVTIDDVEYTYTLDGYAPASIDTVWKDASSNSVVINFTAADGDFLIDGLLLKLVKTDFTDANEPNGCGPFVMDAKVDGQYLLLTAFEDYFNGRPYLDSINYTYYTVFEDAAKDLLNNTIDFIGYNLDISEASKNVNHSGNNTNLMTFANTTVARSFGTDFLFLGYNCAPVNPLNALPLRQAITHCIDKTSIAQLDVSGSAKATDSILSPRDLPWYNTSIKTHSFDLVQANAILNAAGYHDVNGDGWRELPGGATFHLDLLLPMITESLTLVTIGDQILETSIEKVGINVTLNNQQMGNMTGIIQSNNFDMYLGFETRGGISPVFLRTMFHSDTVATDDNWMNFNGASEMVNGTVDANETRKMGQLPKTNLDASKAPIFWRNGRVWGEAVNQTIVPAYNGTNTAKLGNVSISAGYMFFKNQVKMTTGYALDQATGIATFTGLLTNDKINATYKYTTYASLTAENGTFAIVNNFNYTTDTLKATFFYRGVDHTMESVTQSMNITNVTKYVKECQGELSGQVPIAPIMSYMVLNAYVKTRYVGWVSMLGGINNFWSFIGLQNSLLDKDGNVRSLVVDASAYPGYVDSKGTLTVDITVKDGDDNPMPNAMIEASVDMGNLTAITDNGDGTYEATYTAPTTDATVAPTIFVAAAVSGYQSGFANASVTVHPVMLIFSIDIEPGVNSMPSGNSTTVTVTVTDEKTGDEVSGADITVTVEPAGVGGWIEDGTGTTTSSGTFECTLATANVTVDTTFRIVASVSKTGYEPDSATANVAVLRDGGDKPDRGFLGLPGIGAFASIAAIGCAAVFYAVLRRRKER